MDRRIKVGDKVQTCVFVCGECKPCHTGIVINTGDGVSQVDIGSLHGAAPWIVFEATSHLLKV